jgi:hypothetical protein
VNECKPLPEMRSGWLQFLRSCISMLLSAVAPMGACPQGLTIVQFSAQHKHFCGIRWYLHLIDGS